jgi:hypothetical protein
MRILTFILIVNSFVCSGQDIFADNINNFPWTSDEQFDINQMEIGLSILRLPKDSLNTNRTIWTFKETLTVSRYNSNDREEEILLQCKYDFDWDRGLLNIELPNKGILTYRLTFISTGSYILLRRKKGG